MLTFAKCHAVFDRRTVCEKQNKIYLQILLLLEGLSTWGGKLKKYFTFYLILADEVLAEFEI